MKVEFDAMEEKGVWEIVEIEKVPDGRKLVGNRWVYSEKDDGRFRARSVAQGFSQVPGKDFQESHAPVVNDVTFRIILILKLLKKLKTGQFDIETAFLYSDLDEEIWMKFPDGYSRYLKEKHNKDYDYHKYCVKLKKALYGLVQAARQWWKKFKEAMATCHYYPTSIDPCLFIKKDANQKPLAFVIIYVDDGGIIGSDESIKEILQALGNSFKVKSLGAMEHFVGCHIIEAANQEALWIHQPKLLKNLQKLLVHLLLK
jgi:hypothetical protein